MSQLSNFSIETDHTILLQFKNGQERRVPVSQLARHLAGPDLSRVSEALKLRRDFIRMHIPKAGLMLVLAASTIAALLITQGARVATQIIQRGATFAPVPAHDTVATPQPVPTDVPVNTPGINGAPAEIDQPAVPAPVFAPQPTPARIPPRRAAQPAAVLHRAFSPVTSLLPTAVPVSLPDPAAKVHSGSPEPTKTPAAKPF